MRKGLRCAEHKLSGMLDVISSKCMDKGCKSQPVFGIRDGKPQYCVRHKLAHMIDVKNKSCLFTGCSKQPTYDNVGGCGQYCKLHKLTGMVDVKHPTCVYPSCSVRPTFGFMNEKPTRCNTHKITGMLLRTKHNSCSFVGCSIKHAKYGMPGGIATHCFTHKSTDMVQLKAIKYCEFYGCNTKATYNVPTIRSGRFCSLHKLAGMIDVNSTRCSFEGCCKQPTFKHLPTDKKYCGEHKLPESIKIRSNLCKTSGCTISARFNTIGQKKGEFCFSHKSPGMVDVHTIRCVECQTIASYGIPGTKQTHCSKHRKPGMIQRPSHKCKIVGCKQPATHGTLRSALRCDEHKIDSDINMIEKECQSCKLPMIVNIDNLCEYCNPKTSLTIRLQKQNKLFEFLDSCSFLPPASTKDTMIDSICGKERPDRTYDCGDKIIVVECDEHQHRDRNETCERTRMFNIGQTYGGVPVYFLRWNPDNYITTPISKTMESIKERYKLLANLIKDLIENKISLPVCLVSALYLYYDGWKGLEYEEWKVITPLDFCMGEVIKFITHQ